MLVQMVVNRGQVDGHIWVGFLHGGDPLRRAGTAQHSVMPLFPLKAIPIDVAVEMLEPAAARGCVLGRASGISAGERQAGVVRNQFKHSLGFRLPSGLSGSPVVCRPRVRSVSR